MQHHLLNTTLQLPTSAMPVLVTVLLSSRMNAWFYVSWTIVGFIFFVPVALTMVLHAMNSAQQSMLARKTRVTISLALVASALAICLLQFTSNWVLRIFGSSYAEQATCTLRILVFAAFPLVIKNHYISISRIYDRLKSAMLLIAPCSIIELTVATVGGHLGNLTGLSLGWVIAVYIESIFMLPTIYKAITSAQKATMSADISSTSSQAPWLVDTFPLAAISQSKVEMQPLWFIDTVRLPTIYQEYMAAQNPSLAMASLSTITSLDNSSKQSLEGKVSMSNNRVKCRLKPFRLQPHIPDTPYPGHVPITDPFIESKSLQREHDNNPIFEKEH
jgi:hypothetical protein